MKDDENDQPDRERQHTDSAKKSTKDTLLPGLVTSKSIMYVYQDG